MVFLCPIVGHLEDLTSTCVSTFHHAADKFGLNDDDVSLLTVHPEDPPFLLAIKYRGGQRTEEGLPLPCQCWRPPHYSLGRN